jgi:hypothetical protein
MASALIGLRSFTFGIFIVCNTILCSVGVWNLSFVQLMTLYNAQVPAYMIFLGSFGLVCIFPLIFIDLTRRNAFTSRVWVELVWVGGFWIMELFGAAALSATVPNNQCIPHQDKIAATVCLSGKVLLGFAWIITLMMFAYLITLSVCAFMHHSTDPNVWNETVRGYPWFSARSTTLPSTPPSPTVEKGPEALSLKHPRPKAAFNPAALIRSLSPFEDPIQPVPTFDRIPQPSYQPPRRRHEGLHIVTTQDSVPIADPAFTRPRDAPRPPVKVHSLYPEHMQAHLSMEARNHLHNHSKQLEGQEPSPLRDWPKASRNNDRRQPPPPRPHINTEANVSTQQPISSISPNQRTMLSGTTNTLSPTSYRLGSPILGPQSSSTRKQPPPPLNLDGISNTSRRR